MAKRVDIYSERASGGFLPYFVNQRATVEWTSPDVYPTQVEAENAAAKVAVERGFVVKSRDHSPLDP